MSDDDFIETPYSILYEQNGSVHKLGTFKSSAAAMAAARKANVDCEFDIYEQRVYLLDPDHRMQELSMNDILEDDGG